MGLSFSLLFSAWEEILKHRFFSLAYNLDFDSGDGGVTLRRDSFRMKDSETMTKSDELDASDSEDHKHEKVHPEKADSLQELPRDIKKSDSNYSIAKNGLIHMPIPSLALPDVALLFSPRPKSELNAAAVRVQKVYKSYRTRRNLADCAVVVEEMWWKALDSAALELNSVAFFEVEKEQTAFSRWARATARVAKVGKGLSKDEKAQKLALQHWLEAIDPRHRYGHNLHLYYDIWSKSSSFQPFFYWLDVGDGKEVNLAKCPRSVLQQQCIKYLGPKERETYEVIVEDGKLVYRQNGLPVETIEGSKWIFVLSTSRALYVGQKKKGTFQHSSFLSGAAITAAGRLVAHGGILEAIWPYSGHYLPTEENFQEFISFLEDNKVDLTNVKRCAVDDDSPVKSTEEEKPKKEHKMVHSESLQSELRDIITKETSIEASHKQEKPPKAAADQPPVYSELSRRLSCKWSSGYGPRIGCVRDYPTELQNRALEQVNLSPRLTSGPLPNYGPVPSPRPSPKIRVSPRLSYMGLLSPRNSIPAAN